MRMRELTRPPVNEARAVLGKDPQTRMTVFGPFSIVTPDGRDATPVGRKAKGLLAMLALAPTRRRPRSWLQDRLWSDKPSDLGRASLRRELSNLRRHFQQFGLTVMSSAGDDVILDRAVWIDVANGDPAPHHELLEGLDIGDPEFEDWLSEERAYWYGRLQQAPTEPPDLPDTPDPSRWAFPHIAILPFAVIDETSAGRTFTEGLNQELLTVFGALSGTFRIISSEFADERTTDFLLRGNIRGQDNLRVNAGVISATDGAQIWSGRFDASPDKGFAEQETVARGIADAVQQALRDGHWVTSWAGAETSTEAWELFQKGRVCEAAVQRSQHAMATAFYRAAIVADPGFLQARISLGFALIDGIRLCWVGNPDSAQCEAAQVVRQVLDQAPDHIYGRALDAFLRCTEQEFEVALSIMEGVVSDTPESPELLSYLAAIHCYRGNYAQEISIYRHALTLTRFPPLWIRTNLALALLLDGRDGYSDLIDYVLAADPNNHRALLAQVLRCLRAGKLADARQSAQRLKVIDPAFTAETWRSPLFFEDVAVHRAITDELRTAGL